MWSLPGSPPKDVVLLEVYSVAVGTTKRISLSIVFKSAARLAPIQQYPNICRSKRPFGRKEEENPHPSQKSEGLRHPKIESTQKPGQPATISLKCTRTGKSACPTKTLPDDNLQAVSILNDGPANPLRSI